MAEYKSVCQNVFKKIGEGIVKLSAFSPSPAMWKKIDHGKIKIGHNISCFLDIHAGKIKLLESRRTFDSNIICILTLDVFKSSSNLRLPYPPFPTSTNLFLTYISFTVIMDFFSTICFNGFSSALPCLIATYRHCAISPI